MTTERSAEIEMMSGIGFDQWMETKRQRPVGICNSCRREIELRQREPEQLCGPCYMRADRKNKKEADPLVALTELKKRNRKIRSEMNRLLNIVDALEGLIDRRQLEELSQIAAAHLKPILAQSRTDSSGHTESVRDRDHCLGKSSDDSADNTHAAE